MAKKKTNPTELEDLQKQIAEKVKELEARESNLAGYPVKVHVFFANTEELGPAVAYVKDLNRHTKKAALDSFQRSMSSAGDIIIETSALKADSDPRFFDENPAHDDLYLGLNMFVQDLVSYAVNQQKKS